MENSVVQIEQLRRQIDQLQQSPCHGETQAVSSGCPLLDQALPERGFRRGTLVEWLSVGMGTGAETLALMTARQACGEDGILVVVDAGRRFHPPAAVRLGIRPEQLIVIHASNKDDNHWALDQALRC